MKGVLESRLQWIVFIIFRLCVMASVRLKMKLTLRKFDMTEDFVNLIVVHLVIGVYIAHLFYSRDANGGNK